MQHGFLAVKASVTKAEVLVLTTRCRVNQYKVFLRAKLFLFGIKALQAC